MSEYSMAVGAVVAVGIAIVGIFFIDLEKAQQRALPELSDSASSDG